MSQVNMKPNRRQHLSVSDESLKKLTGRILDELKLPSNPPSVVIFAALKQVRDAALASAKLSPPAVTRKRAA